MVWGLHGCDKCPVYFLAADVCRVITFKAQAVHTCSDIYHAFSSKMVSMRLMLHAVI